MDNALLSTFLSIIKYWSIMSLCDWWCRPKNVFTRQWIQICIWKSKWKNESLHVQTMQKLLTLFYYLFNVCKFTIKSKISPYFQSFFSLHIYKKVREDEKHTNLSASHSRYACRWVKYKRTSLWLGFCAQSDHALDEQKTNNTSSCDRMFWSQTSIVAIQ